MAHKLADETLRDIFADHLSVPDADFVSTDARSPFSRVESSSSNLLAVCKRWMRICTPLLYHCVILRSTPQAVALADALKKNKHFGAYIHKLRVEGAFGAAVGKLLVSAPNITDFAFTMKLFSEDRPKPMCDAMHGLDPRRVVAIAFAYGTKMNKATRLIVDTFSSCLNSWNNIETLIVPAHFLWHNSDLVQRFKTYDGLREVTLTGVMHNTNQEHMNRLAENKSIQVIRVGWTEQDRDLELRYGLDTTSPSEDAIAKTKFAEPSTSIPVFRRRTPTAATDAQPRDSNYVPMANQPAELRRSVWSTVFKFLLRPFNGVFPYSYPPWDFADELDLALSEMPLDDEDDEHLHLSRLRSTRPPTALLIVMSVCSEWRDAAQRVACHELNFRTERQLQSFAALLGRRPELAAEVRSIRIGMRPSPWHSGGMHSGGRMFFVGHAHARQSRTVLKDEMVDVLASVLIELKNVQVLTCEVSFPLPVHAFDALVVAAGSSLIEIKNLDLDGTLQLTTLEKLSALRRLRVPNNAQGKLVIAKQMDPAHRPRLPALQEIILLHTDTPFADILSQCELPALTTLTLQRSMDMYSYEWIPSAQPELSKLLDAHGAKVLRACVDGTTTAPVLAKCPNMQVLDFATRPDEHHIELFEIKTPHTALETINFPSMVAHWQPSAARDDNVVFFDELDPARFPALRTITVPNRNLWPTTQRDIGRSAWPQTAERLLSQGVRILDGAGVAWRPRLKTAQAPRKRKTKGAQAQEEGQTEQSGASTSMQAPVQKAKRPRKRRAPRYYDDYDDWSLPEMASGLVSQMLDEMADFY